MQNKQNKSKKRRIGEIPTGSFSDIAFLLIIYFLVATTLTKMKGFQADMPSGETDNQATKKDDTPSISLTFDRIHYGEEGKLVTLDVLNERLAALNLREKEGEKKVVLLEATPDTPYDLYFKVLGAISKNGGVVAMMEEEE
jgi:biopolymer transport protein ExbD